MSRVKSGFEIVETPWRFGWNLAKNAGAWAVGQALDYIEPRVQAHYVSHGPELRGLDRRQDPTLRFAISVRLGNPVKDRDNAELMIAAREIGAPLSRILAGVGHAREHLDKAITTPPVLRSKKR